MKFKIPIKTVSEANKGGEHWTKKHKRHKAQKAAVELFLSGKVDETCLPCIIKFTRIAPRLLDKDENLPMSFKNVKDYVCNLLIPGKQMGRADSDPRIQVTYAQIKGAVREYAIEVEIIKNE